MPDVATIRAFLEDEHVQLAEDVSRFVNAELARLPEPPDDPACRLQAREVLALVGGAGWFRPIENQDLRGCSLVREALASTSPLADAVFALQGLSATPILLAGDDRLREEWLEPACAGRVMGAFAMTETEAGSDVSSLATTARRDGDEYVLDGAKTLISNAGIADFYTVFAATDRDRGAKGISCFVVPADQPGLEFVGPQIMSAPHPLGEIRFDGCRVSRDARLGEEGEGFKLGLATLDQLRTTVGAAACGMAARALAEARRHALERVQFGKPLAEFQIVRQKLARMAVGLTASRLLVYRAAWEKDRGAARVTVESAMAKAFATEEAQRIVDDAVQVVGGRGVVADHPVDRLYRSVRALRIYEGTTEIQHLIIARHLLQDDGS